METYGNWSFVIIAEHICDFNPVQIGSSVFCKVRILGQVTYRILENAEVK